MEDLELTLINYIPFTQNGVYEFIYTPTKPIQLIIGSNGSGKSSLKRQLSPLPGEASDFLKGGKKIVRMGQYVLTSDFSKGGSGEHFFIKDGINLNTGKTLSVQKVLVKEEFGITKEIHSLLIAEKGYVFSEMSPAKRKEWLTMLSPSNFDFIIDVYQHAATTLRDKVGAIKHITGKLNSIVQNNDSDDEAETSESVRDNVAFLEKSLVESRMFQDAMLNTIPNKKISLRRDEVLSRIDNVSTKIIRGMQGPMRDVMIGLDIDNLSGAIANNNTYISVNKREIETLTDRIQQLEVYIENAKIINDAGNSVDLNLEVESLKKQLPDYLIGVDPHPLHMSFIATRSAVLDALGSMVYSEIYSRENIQRLRAMLDDVINRRGAVITGIDHDAYKLQRLNRAIAVACKKCGFYECSEAIESVDTLTARIESRNAESLKLQSEIDDINEQLSVTEDWGRYTKSLQAIKAANTDINQFFWKEFIAKEIYKQSYDVIRKYFDACDAMLNIAINLYSLEKRKSEIAKASRVTGSYAGMSYDDAVTMLETTCASRLDLYNQNDVLQRKSKLIEDLIQHMENSDTYLNELVDNLYSELRDIVKNEMNTTIFRIEKAIGYQYSRLTELEGRRKLIEELSAQMTELKSDIAVYEILTKKLSPNTGLIAKLLTSSINSVLGNMNLTIESVWTYPLTIDPCNIEDGKLDYKFPMTVKNTPVPVKDIGMGSSGQADIIDFAFRAVAYRALDIKSYPLFLDEFGASFDEQHKFNTTELIKMLSQSGKHPYVFFISHYYGQHGGLSNNETLVMDDANVSVPPVYNQHVIMR